MKQEKITATKAELMKMIERLKCQIVKSLEVIESQQGQLKVYRAENK